MLDFDKDVSQQPQGVGMHRALISAATQHELAASVVPAAVARQSFLARRAGRAGRAYIATLAADTSMPECGYGTAPHLVRLLGRGEDASNAPRRDNAAPKLPTLFGQRSGGGRSPPNYDDANEKEIGEQVREAFLARQSRIMGRSAVTMVP